MTVYLVISLPKSAVYTPYIYGFGQPYVCVSSCSLSFDGVLQPFISVISVGLHSPSFPSSALSYTQFILSVYD